MASAMNINRALAAILRDTQPDDCRGNVAFVHTRYQFHADKLKSESFRGLLEDIVSAVLGRRVRVVVSLKEREAS